MKLSNIINGIELMEICAGANATEKRTEDVIAEYGNIESVQTDSRKCTANSLFIAVKGIDNDGHKYIGSAIEKGASAVICEYLPDDMANGANSTLFLLVKDGRRAAALAASNFYGNPSHKLKLVGVTGTNGKTSIATLLYRLFKGLGYQCGLLSTIANYVGDKRYETINTTPGPVEINRLLNEMTEAGCGYCFMEVSSHAIDQERVAGLEFTGGIFTNLTHDHLDYHRTFANYLNCKKRFFDNLGKEAFALVNADDKNGKVMVQNTKARISTFAVKSPATFHSRILERSIEGILLNINGKEAWFRFMGDYNASNLTAIYGAAVLLGEKEDEIIRGMSSLTPVEGRLEYFRGANDIVAAVDYAHTPDALENVLRTLKELNPEGGIVTVFGCGGNRDKTKRPEMGAIAAKYSDRIVVTSDNPRFEEPSEIINEIKEGMDLKGRAKSLFITDREEAIRTAILTAQPGAIILVAGKGHENYQIVNGEKRHFDDREIVRKYLSELEIR